MAADHAAAPPGRRTPWTTCRRDKKEYLPGVSGSDHRCGDTHRSRHRTGCVSHQYLDQLMSMIAGGSGPDEQAAARARDVETEPTRNRPAQDDKPGNP